MQIEQFRFWRLFISTPLLQALVIGLLASVLANSFWSLAPVTSTILDWTLYDTWLRHRAPIATSSNLAVVVSDPQSEARLGAVLDRSILAQVVTRVHEAGAAAIGIDHRLDRASPASLGGAASDALLLDAMDAAAPLVFIHDPERALSSEGVITAHAQLTTQPDHVTRLIPLLTVVQGKAVPAFGSVLYDLYRQQHRPAGEPLTTERASALINPVGTGVLSALPTIPLSSVWDAIQHQDKEQLERWFKDKAVVILPTQSFQDSWLLPTGQSVSGIVAHLHLLNSLLTDQEVTVTGRWAGIGLTLLLAACIAFGLLRFDGTVSLFLAGSVLLLYAILATALLWSIHLVLPLPLPLTAACCVIVGTIAWGHLSADQRRIMLEQDMLRLQQDVSAVREALILRQNSAEALEEDLETAKAAVMQSTTQQEEMARSTASMRAQLVDAQMQEQAARRRLDELERRLSDLRIADRAPPTMGDAELDRLKQECREVGIVTQQPELLRMFHDLKRGAASPLTVLLLGEPGTGKELFARAVHQLSSRAQNAFIPVNMAAISPELFESELFGHTKGSFTGAAVDRRGFFELAHRGTIFLDEIGDLRLDHQSKLLRVLQEKSFYRVGATVPTTVDVRIVAATNRDLQRGVSEGWFREDLYFRLKGFVFRLPPLRDRPGDIAVIAEATLTDIAQRTGRPHPQLSNDALRLLNSYRWPGNVRELRNVLERAVALSDGSVLSRHAFTLEDVTMEEGEGRDVTVALPDEAGDIAVLDRLRRHGFDMQATAKALSWDRSTVTQRLKGLCFQALVESGGDRAKAVSAIAGDSARFRTVELKMNGYYDHLLSVIQPCNTIEEALAECKRRFKNIPDRHFASVDRLVRTVFLRKPSRTSPSTAMTET
jgi:transcriptional regulator with PAS, ATPase and Fis domain/CHASE2 domain-containing sensor protein